MQLATVSYATTIERDGRAYHVEIPALTVPQCGNCQAISIDDEADRQISAAFRRDARLLAPELQAEITRRWGDVIRRYGYATPPEP